jgi:hypothetical protein
MREKAHKRDSAGAIGIVKEERSPFSSRELRVNTSDATFSTLVAAVVPSGQSATPEEDDDDGETVGDVVGLDGGLGKEVQQERKYSSSVTSRTQINELNLLGMILTLPPQSGYSPLSRCRFYRA